MSRNDLTRIQHQLKEAIQIHQVLVSKLKCDPQSADLKLELKKKQAEIAGLSAKQKKIIQQVREELLTKKPGDVPGVSKTTSTPLTPNDGEGVIQQQSKKSTAAVLKVPQFYSSAGVTTSVGSRPSLLGGQSREVQQRPPAPAAVPATTIAVSAPSLQAGALTDLSADTAGGYSRISDAHFTAIARSALKIATGPRERLKLEFMAALDLITTDTMAELQRKRTERKRRTTANPLFSYQDSLAFETKKHVYLSNAGGVKRPRGRPQTARAPLGENHHSSADSRGGSSAAHIISEDAHDDFCAVCRRSGELLLCDTCNLVYHLDCLNPPLSVVPEGMWSCPKCIALRKPQSGGGGVGQKAGATGKASGGGSVVAAVQAFIEQKASKEEEKLILLKHNAELSSEKQRLEAKADRLTDTLAQQLRRNAQLQAAQSESLRSAKQISEFVRVFQN